MIAMTTKSSMRVNPKLRLGNEGGPTEYRGFPTLKQSRQRFRPSGRCREPCSLRHRETPTRGGEQRLAYHAWGFLILAP